VGRVRPESMGAAKAMGVDTVLDYRQPIPARLLGTFDVVFDTHGSLSVKDERRAVKKGGVILDINPSPAKMARIFLSPGHHFVMARQDQETLHNVVNLASKGKLKMSVGRVVRLADGIDLLQELEAGLSINGKGVIVMGS